MSVTTHWLNPMRLSILVYLPRIQKIAVKEMNDLEKYYKKAGWSGVSFHRNGFSHGHHE